MIEIGAGQAERSFSLQTKKAPLPEFLTTFRADRIADDPEDNDLVSGGCHRFGASFIAIDENGGLTCQMSRAPFRRRVGSIWGLGGLLIIPPGKVRLMAARFANSGRRDAGSNRQAACLLRHARQAAADAAPMRHTI